MYFVPRYVLSLETASEQEQYLSEMLDPANNTSHAQFIKEFVKKTSTPSAAAAIPGIRAYRKADENQDYVVGAGKQKKNNKSQEVRTND